MAEYEIYLRDANLQRVAEVDHFAKLELVLRFDDVSTWALDAPAGGVAARNAVAGNGIIVRRDGETILSGPIRPQRRVWAEDRSMATLAGPDDTVFVHDRLALPVPSGPPYTAAEHDVRTGVASTVMLAYVHANAALGASVPRRAPFLQVATDPLIGATVTGRARFVNLLELLQSLALSGGDLGFRVVQLGFSQVLEFQVYQPVDRTASAIFSPLLGTLRGFEYAVDPPEANHVIVGGGGEGTARLFVEAGDSASIVTWGRIEQFRDRRDTTDAAELAQTAAEELEEKAIKTSLGLTPIDTEALAFGTDYGLGDRVTVVITDDSDVVDPVLEPLVTTQELVRGVRITVTEEGETVEPIIGTPDAQNPSARATVLRIFGRQRAVAERLSRLERR